MLTGFDAPILQVMYLDKPMKDHNLLQAICRTNRVYTGKTHGLIVDYLGIFDDVATALDFDEKAVQKVITNLDDLKKELPGVVAKCLAFFPGVDRTVGGYEGLIAAQDCLPDNETRDKFAAEYSVLSRLWEALSPDPCLGLYQTDYKWLTQIYESVKPPSGNGKLLWHTLGAKTIELVHENVHLETVRDDLDTLVMDAEVLEGLLDTKDPEKKSKEIEIKIIARLRKHKDNPKFVALGERLEKLKERHEQGLLHSIDFLKELLTLAKETMRGGVSAAKDPWVRQNIAQFLIEFSAVKYTDLRALSKQLKGEMPGWEGSICKLGSSALNLRATAFAADLLGPYGQLTRDCPQSVDRGAWIRQVLMARALTIGGGTSEIQRSILATRALDLPRK